MRLAADDIVIAIAGYSPVILHPSLRAALRIARRYHGFAEPLEMVAAGNLTVMIDLLRKAGAGQLADLFNEVGTFPLALTMGEIAEPLIRFLFALAGIDPDKPEATSPQGGAQIPFLEHFERLFQAATGALGWTPETAWAATPDEILAALDGWKRWNPFIGGTDEGSAPTRPANSPLDPSFEPDTPDPAFDRKGWDELRAGIMQGTI